MGFLQSSAAGVRCDGAASPVLRKRPARGEIASAPVLRGVVHRRGAKETIAGWRIRLDLPPRRGAQWRFPCLQLALIVTDVALAAYCGVLPRAGNPELVGADILPEGLPI